MGPNFEKFLDHMIRSKWKFWKIVCCFQANADWFVYNKHHLSTINRFWFKSKISDFLKNHNFVLTIIKGTTVTFFQIPAFLKSNSDRNQNDHDTLTNFFPDEPNKKIKTCSSMINWILQSLFSKITTWKKNFRKKNQRNFRDVLRVLTLFVSVFFFLLY